MGDEKKSPRKVKFYRIVPQLKTFKVGTVLKNKIDLYYSLEEDIVETGSEDSFSPLVNFGGNHQSFPETDKFICKDTMMFLVETAQFRANDNNIYVRLEVLTGTKVVWVNLLRVPNKIWSFMIRSEQKKMIKEEINNMFDVIINAETNTTTTAPTITKLENNG